MIISTFKTGKGKSRGPLNYLLGKDKDNKPRDPAPTIVKGDRKLTEVLIDSNHRQYKYTSGAIAFRDTEKPTDEQINKIIRDFETAFTPGLQKRVPILWVKHQEKGNTELHFVCPMQDAQTGKQFNICPPGEQFKQMFRDFQAFQNDKNGWEQVRGNLFKAQMTELDKAVPENKEKSLKEILSKELENQAKNGKLNNRNELVDFLKKTGFEITRTGKDYLSVKHKNSLKATRLKGPAFSLEANYKELLQKKDKPVNLDEKEKKEVRARLERAIRNRRKSLLKQLDNVDKGVPDDDVPVDDEGGSSGGDIATTITIDKDAIEQLHHKQKQSQPTAGLPQISSPVVRKFKAG